MTDPVAIRLPAGVRDFLPRAAARRRAIAERLLSEFERWGYKRIITPMFECSDVLERGLGADARAAAIRFVEPGTGEVVALRPDITPQVARLAATRMAAVDGPLRLCYEGAVTRIASGPRGQREILQAGIELIAADSPRGDAEALSVAAAALATSAKLGIDEVRLDVGHVALVRHALGAVTDPDRRRVIEALLAKKDRAGVVAASRRLGVKTRAVLAALPTLFGEPTEVLARARALTLPPQVRSSLDTLEQVMSLTADVVEAALHSSINFDLGELRGFDYYTGLRFAGYVAGHGDAVLRGGRYDELVGRYGRPAHAIGFAVDIEALAQAERAAGIRPYAPRPSVLVVAESRDLSRDATLVASLLRARDVQAAVDLAPQRDRAALLEYARDVGFTHLFMIGSRGGVALDLARANEPGRRVSSASIRKAQKGEPTGLLAALSLARFARVRRA